MALRQGQQVAGLASVPPTLVVSGLACGMILTACAAMMLARSRAVDELSRAYSMLTWMAATLLLAAAVVGWARAAGTPAVAPRLLLVAAVVAPVSARRVRAARTGLRVQTTFAILLAGSGLVGAWVFAQTGPPAITGSGHALAGLSSVAAAVAAGLGIRYGSSTIARTINLADEGAGPPGATYAMLSVVVGLSSISSLWTRGVVRLGAPAHAGLAAAFLAWSAVWLFPRVRRVGHTCFAAGAAIWLLRVALALV